MILPVIRHNLEHLNAKVAFRFLTEGEIDGATETLTFAALDARVRAVTAILLREGFMGERALLLYEPGLEFIVAFLACLHAGVIAVPAYPPDMQRLERSLGRLRGITKDCLPATVLTSSFIAEAAEGMTSLVPEIGAARILTTDRISNGVDDYQPPRDFAKNDVAFLQYTSGSTAVPRGVKVTHGNLHHNLETICRLGRLSSDSVTVFWLPNYHDMGLIAGILEPLFTGFTGILMSPMAFLKRPVRWLRAISHFRGTDSAFPNFALDLCVRKVPDDEIKRLDLSSWVNACNGAEPIRIESLRMFAERFRVCGFRQEALLPVYGLAESTLIASGERENDAIVIKTISRDELTRHRVRDAQEGEVGAVSFVGCGRAINGHEVVIVDPEKLQRTSDGEVGEIWFRGTSVALGYWGAEESTAAVFGARLSDTGEGPFLRTGDLGFLENGQIFVTGRRKDIIIIRGANHYPQEIEAVTEQAHPAIRPGSVAAVGLNGKNGEELALVLEVRDGLSAEQWREVAFRIRETIVSALGLWASKVAILPGGALPKTSSGKIQRHACKEDLETGVLTTLYVDITAPAPENVVDRSSPAGPDPVHSGVLDALVGVTGTPRDIFQSDTRLIGYVGLDSLRTTEVIVELEKRFGILGEGLFADAQMTFGDLVRIVGERIKLRQEQPSTTTTTPSPKTPHPAREMRIEDFGEVRETRTLLLLFRALGIENPYWNSLDGAARDMVRVDGTPMLNFATYNYLGLSGDPRVNAAATRAVEQYGTSASASRVASGNRPVHRLLEQEIARFLGCEDALVFASGHATNVTAVSTLVGPGDLILHDSLAHDSLLAGARLSGARHVAFPHNDMNALERMLGELRGLARRALIIVEGTYSMDGDTAPLHELVAIKKRHDAMLYIDEAHSIGCVGATGRGIGEDACVDRRDVDVWMGTLSKAFASCGGYVAGSRSLVDLLKYRGGGFVYAAAISPTNAAAACEALRILDAEPNRVNTLQQRAASFLQLCRDRGIDTGNSKATAIVPIIVGGSVRCLQIADALRLRGIHAPPIFYPAVEEGRARLRFFVSALHSEEQLTQTADALATVLAEHPVIAPVKAPQGAPISSHTRAFITTNPAANRRPQRAFVTGASGFIGSRVVRQLIAKGYEVRCLLRPTSKTHRLAGLTYEVQQGDLDDDAALETGAKGCDAVIHLACASAWSELRALGERVFVVAIEGTRHVLDAARRAGVRRFVYVSSAAAINASEQPMLFDESSPYEIEHRGLAYSLAKRRAEQLVQQYAADGLDAVITSPAEVYGPEDDGFVTAGNLLDILRAPAPITCQGGTSIAHVDDVAQGIVAALEHGRKGERYILGGENVTIRDLTRMVLRIAGKREAVLNVPNAALMRLSQLMREAGLEPPVSEDALDYATLYWFVNSNKARRELGYRPRDAQNTLVSVVDWLREMGLA